MESEDGTEATIDNPATAEGLQMLHDMRWTDDSMGQNTGYEWTPINEAFAAGKIGMYMSGSDVYNALTTTNQINPDTYGLAALPLADNAEAGILGGGSVNAVSAKATPAQQEAAIAWADFYRVQKLYDKDAAILDAKTLTAADQPVGTPTLPAFDEATYQQTQEWIAPYVNVPLDQMSSFVDRIFSQQLISEPPSKTQEVYGLLDSVVQKVLTDENADIASLLSDTDEQAQKLLDAS
jgi:ABC-type glycerol-3-phosphate transport system substrate-binding protein